LVHFNIGKGCPTGWTDNQFLYNPFKAIIALEDLEGRPLFVNPALCSMLGPSEEEMRGKYCVDFSPREGAELISGDLSIDSRLQQGTTIRARVPLSPRTKSARAGE
jgi:PAS domain S-box-containing protein